MDAVCGLLLLLLLHGTSHGVETFCDGRQNGTKCYGALGGTVVLRLMDDASKIFSYQWIFNTTTILRLRNNMILSNLIEKRSSFSPSNGTFRINDLSRNDGGEYTLEVYKDNSGTNQEKRTLQLTIQAPVSSVLLVSECLSQGEMKASCSSEGGDSPQYRWTLGGRTLTQTQLLSGNSESQNITVKQDVSGELVCSVRNDVSVVRKEKQTCGFTFLQCTLSNGTYISNWFPPAYETLCPQPTPEALPLLYCGLRAAVVFLILTGIFVYFACKKNDLKKAEGSAVHEVTEYENDSVVMLEMRSSASRL
ncbi:carcinoembryonic antigen-related cell adhesion molecule 2 isoform X2 [Labrus bergylta]|uniref:carcinoembryonic antigen-related cell adhesion molecule 2 isoform X2 n=1 Tax=Labrus bergylta TaxID=56723 RepID=UPI003313D352